MCLLYVRFLQFAQYIFIHDAIRCIPKLDDFNGAIE